MKILQLLLVTYLFSSIHGQVDCDKCVQWKDATECQTGNIKIQVCVDKGLEQCKRTVPCDGIPCGNTFCRSTDCYDEVCNPLTGRCDRKNKPDETPCDDGSACTEKDICRDGKCIGLGETQCKPSDQCKTSVCDPATGKCIEDNAPDGQKCDDGNACTQDDFCKAGTCVGTNPVTCAVTAGPDSCHEEPKCDPQTGKCYFPEKPDGTPCDDFNRCTQKDVCQSGKCVGTDPVTCKALDQCHDVGVCNPQTGTCSNPIVQPGTKCDDDNACTTDDMCNRAGQCVGRPTCVPSEDGCIDRVCDPKSGWCMESMKADGTACDDGDACTQTDKCVKGKCVGEDPVKCDGDMCHDAGKCDPRTGRCDNPQKPDGTKCDDGNECTQVDLCRAGNCVGTSPVVCTASDQCHVAGTCDRATGKCSNPPQADGTACNDGNSCTNPDRCRAGVCVGINTIQCPPPDQCHGPAQCSPTGGCFYPIKPDGTTCNDGNLCTQTDRCVNGQCVGSNPVTCPAPDQCHLQGVCLATTGTCTNPIKPNQTPCNDGNGCTIGDVCNQGTCVGSPKICTTNQCMSSSCIANTGICSPLTPKPVNTPCNDGNACTINDRCTSTGTCRGTIICISGDLTNTEKTRRHATTAEDQHSASSSSSKSLSVGSRLDAVYAGIGIFAVVAVIALVAAVVRTRRTSNYTHLPNSAKHAGTAPLAPSNEDEDSFI